jgi:hypothetical protein
MNLYRNEINQMDDVELLALADRYNLVLEDRENVDADEVIDLIEYYDSRVYESVEDDILESIRNDKCKDGAKQMLENNITPHGLIDYVNDYRFEQNEDAYEWFDLSSAVAITELYHETRRGS